MFQVCMRVLSALWENEKHLRLYEYKESPIFGTFSKSNFIFTLFTCEYLHKKVANIISHKKKRKKGQYTFLCIRALNHFFHENFTFTVWSFSFPNRIDRTDISDLKQYLVYLKSNPLPTKVNSHGKSGGKIVRVKNI